MPGFQVGDPLRQSTCSGDIDQAGLQACKTLSQRYLTPPVRCFHRWKVACRSQSGSQPTNRAKLLRPRLDERSGSSQVESRVETRSAPLAVPQEERKGAQRAVSSETQKNRSHPWLDYMQSSAKAQRPGGDSDLRFSFLASECTQHKQVLIELEVYSTRNPTTPLHRTSGSQLRIRARGCLNNTEYLRPTRSACDIVKHGPSAAASHAQ